jgi:hypothetical protein
MHKLTKHSTIIKNLFFALFILQFASCTIEKRRYNSGYHIDWQTQNRIPSKHDPEDSLVGREKNDSDHSFSPEKNQVSSALQQLESSPEPIITENNAIDYLASPPERKNESKSSNYTADEQASIHEEISCPAVSTVFFNYTENENKSESLATKKRKKGSRGTIAGILVATAWLMVFIGTGLIINGGSLAVVLILSLLSNILAITGFIMGCRAVKKAKKGKGKTGAIIAIVLGGIYCLLLLISILTIVAA